MIFGTPKGGPNLENYPHPGDSPLAQGSFSCSRAMLLLGAKSGCRHIFIGTERDQPPALTEASSDGKTGENKPTGKDFGRTNRKVFL